MKEGQVYNRADIVNFAGLTPEATTFQRMKGFTSGGRSLNASEYSRRYIDEKTERVDTVAYATAIAYAFDRMFGNPIHDYLAKVHDNELTGEMIPIVTVNFNEPVDNGYKAKFRLWSIAPEGDGESTDAYDYTGSFKANGSIIEGVAKVLEGNTNEPLTITAISFEASGEQATQLVTFNVSDADGQVANAKIAINSANTVYTDVNGIAMVDLSKGTYSKIVISKTGYTTQNSISVTVDGSSIYKAITLEKAS